MNKFVIRQSLLLLLTAIVWGIAFVAQSVGMEYVGPFTFIASRSYIGFAVLLPVIAVLDSSRKKQIDVHQAEGQNQPELYGWNNKMLLPGGIACGVILVIASSLQQIGIGYTTVGKAGFITAMYIILVPIIHFFFKKKSGIRIWLSVIIAVAGLYLLCMTGSFSFQYGDMMVLMCAIVFSFHILTVDYFSPKVDGVKMACIQFLVCGILASVCMFLFETPQISDVLCAWKSILYAGMMSSGVGYTLQIVGQRGMNPTVASLIMSLESVVSVIAGFLLLNQEMSRRELWGCVLMFLAIILAQLPDKSKTEE